MAEKKKLTTTKAKKRTKFEVEDKLRIDGLDCVVVQITGPKDDLKAQRITIKVV